MRMHEVSEPIYRDLLECKSKVEDLKLMLLDPDPAWTKKKLIEELTVLAFCRGYQMERTEE